MLVSSIKNGTLSQEDCYRLMAATLDDKLDIELGDFIFL